MWIGRGHAVTKLMPGVIGMMRLGCMATHVVACEYKQERGRLQMCVRADHNYTLARQPIHPGGVDLALDDEADEFVCVQPGHPADDAEGGQHPPAHRTCTALMLAQEDMCTTTKTKTKTGSGA